MAHTDLDHSVAPQFTAPQLKQPATAQAVHSAAKAPNYLSCNIHHTYGIYHTYGNYRQKFRSAALAIQCVPTIVRADRSTYRP